MQPVIYKIRDFIKSESASGILLIGAAVLALLLANSPFGGSYEQFLDITMQIRAGSFNLEKPLFLWINDGLMALFFFLVGLELKRELVDGELSQPGNLTLPVLAAIGGMAFPAAIYVAMNWGDSLALSGWAIPAATDIAFALGILSLLGDRVPVSLKVFLVSLAIIDDIGAIVIIALFYTANLSLEALALAGLCLVTLFIMNRRQISRPLPYLLVGLVLWTSVLKSGVHATLAGVALAFFIPYRTEGELHESMVKELEHDLHPTVAYFVLPIFAFANAGVPLAGITLDSLLHPVPLGIAAGLVLGKTIGVFGISWLAVALKLTKLPSGMDWRNLLGVSMLTGIGFTMSLFIASLAFEESGLAYSGSERLGIMIGSTVAAMLGYCVLRWVLPKSPATHSE